MQIDRIILRDVGPFKDVTIPLPRGQDRQLADVYLLTGPNGSGKSTVLYTLGALLGGGHNAMGQGLLARRFRTETALAGFAAGELHRVAARHGSQDTIADPFGGAELKQVGNTNDGLAIYGNDQAPGADYARRAGAFRSSTPPSQFSWAVVAYGGKRTLDRGHVRDFQEVPPSPFNESLSFVGANNTTDLANWVVAQRFRQFKAQDAGRKERAEQLGHGIRETERMIGEIVDDDTFRFIITEDDNDVRVTWHGKVIDLDLLPDGLKSIISWIADLLMRLDRMPWVNDVPVLQRSFLLLLDEVDIHLHPAWQRKVLPLVQGMFPNAQIIATTHSPFVVTSVADAHIVTFALKDGASVVEHVVPSQTGVSYSAVLRSIFGIDSEFDVATEDEFRRFHEAKARLLSGVPEARAEVDQVAVALANRSEEVKELIALELAQLRRQLARPRP